MESTHTEVSVNKKSGVAGGIRMFFTLGAFVDNHRALLMLGLVCSTAFPLLGLGIAWVTQILINAILQENFGLLEKWILISASAMVLLTIFGVLGEFFRGYVQSLIARNAGAKVLEHILSLPILTIRRYHSGDLISRVTEDCPFVADLFTSNVFALYSGILSTLIAIVYLIHVNFVSACATAALGPITLFSGRMFDRKLREVSLKIQNKAAEIRSSLQEWLQGMMILRVFGNQNTVISEYGSIRREQNQLSLYNTALSMLMSEFIPWVNQAVGMVLLAFLASEAIQGRISVGEVLGFYIMMSQVLWPFIGLSQTWGSLQKAFGAGNRVFSILELSTEALSSKFELVSVSGVVASSGERTNQQAPILEFRDVHFAYPNRDASEYKKTLLSHFSLRVCKGEMVAVVGASGAGKSTVAQLACGLLVPDGGEILINEINIKHSLMRSRREIAYVPQDPYLFTGTVLDNIAYGRPEASYNEIVVAAQMAHADEFINRLNRGYETKLGEQGAGLSGGQRQRIALARAFLRNAPLVILDEATSSLDSESEKAIQESMATLREERTILVIAHRLSTVQKSNRIIVMDQGRIVESGSHNELLAAGRNYKKLHDLEFGLIV